MAKTRIECGRVWSASKVRSLCVKRNFYTCGDNEAYGRMLLYVDKHNPSKENIFRVAEDIYNHSEIDLDEYGCEKDDMIAGIMFDISRECVSEYFKIHREA